MSYEIERCIANASPSEKHRLIIASRKILGSTQSAVLATLHTYSQKKTGDSRVSAGRIAQVVGVTERHLRKVLSKLVNENYITNTGWHTVEGRTNGDGFQTRIRLRRVNYGKLGCELSRDALLAVLNTRNHPKDGVETLDHPVVSDDTTLSDSEMQRVESDGITLSSKGTPIQEHEQESIQKKPFDTNDRSHSSFSSSDASEAESERQDTDVCDECQRQRRASRDEIIAATKAVWDRYPVEMRGSLAIAEETMLRVLTMMHKRNECLRCAIDVLADKASEYAWSTEVEEGYCKKLPNWIELGGWCYGYFPSARFLAKEMAEQSKLNQAS